MNSRICRLKLWLCGGWVMMAAMAATAAPALDTENPLGFFTNVASRLLASEMNLDLTHIQVYPTNQYTPAAHRLLQVAANVYDATTTNNYPSVFRPLFSRDQDGWGTNVYISGYQQVISVDLNDSADHQTDPPVDASFLATTNGIITNLAMNIYDVPWIVGAKKGFPNFNKFSLESVVGITRRLQVTRPSLNGVQPDFPSFRTNQMYTMSVSNYLGVEFWNSYASGYTGAVQIVARDYLSAWLTNDSNLSVSRNFVSGVWVNSAGTTWGWSGYGASIATPEANSFVIPLLTDAILLPESVYRFTPIPHFEPIDSNNITHVYYETNLTSTVGSPFPFPHFGLLMTNHLQAFVLDGAKIIDYVHFQQVIRRDLNAEIFTDDSQGVWTGITNNIQNLPQAVFNQLNISRGISDLRIDEDGQWKLDPVAWQQSIFRTIEGQQSFFSAFFHPFNRTAFPVAVTNSLLSVQVPYSPTRYVVGCIFLQANDPLVHYLASDLRPYYATRTVNPPIAPPAYLTNLNGFFLGGVDFRELNKNYQPWGGSPRFSSSNVFNFNLSLKDPLVWGSDDWNFPTYVSSGTDWLGQVHRGTPWQTIYLKASDILRQVQMFGGITNWIGTNTWMNWTGDFDAADAAAMAPVQDRHLASLLAALLNTNDLRSLFSINNSSPDSWQARFDGLTALTNNLPDSLLHNGTHAAQFDTLVVASNSTQALVVANAIQVARAGQPNQYFRDVGDLLAIPQLSEQSPFLNWSSVIQQTNGISDEAYEAIPSQLLSLLRADSIGSIAPTNGQMQIQFTGYDGHSYAVETSADLIHWTRISTNSPANGVFRLAISAPASAGAQFYRSVLQQ